VIDRIADPWVPRTPYGRPATAERVAARLPASVRARLPARLSRRAWPVRVDAYLEPGVTGADVDRWVQSASILHSNGDALDIAVKDGRIVGVSGRAVERIGGSYASRASGAPVETNATRMCALLVGLPDITSLASRTSRAGFTSRPPSRSSAAPGAGFGRG
jgi:hypothetical protein